MFEYALNALVFLPLSMAHMLPATVPDCFQRKRVASVSAAVGRGMEILVHLEREAKEMETFKLEVRGGMHQKKQRFLTRCSCQRSRRCCEVGGVQHRALADTRCGVETKSDLGW